MPPAMTAASTAVLLVALSSFIDPAVGTGAVAIAIAAKASSDNDGSCPANFYSCASQGSQFDGICCPYDQVCALAGDNRPACCPSG